jgi:ABC-type sugar transport system permease subunit
MLSEKRVGRKIYKRIFPYLCLTPLFLFLLLFLAYPIIFQIVLSVFRVPLNLQFQYVGLKNFLNLIRDPDFINSLRNATIFVGGSVAGQTGLGFLTAVLLRNVKVGRNFFRAIFLIPWLLSDVSIGSMYILMFNDYYGTINEILASLKLNKINFFTSTEFAIWVVTIANIWKSFCIVMLINSAALNSIPEELYEVARIDGASPLQSFRHITLSLMKPFIALSLIITTMATFNYFGLIYVMTYGGPLDSTTVPAFYMYRWALEWGDFGYAASVGVIILVVNLTLTTLYIKLLLRGEI